MLQIKEKELLKMEINAEIPDFEADDENSLPTKELIEVEVLLPVAVEDERRAEIHKGISEIDEKLDAISSRVDELNSEIDNLTNHADGIDYAIAVTCGLVTGIIDSLVVGEWDFKKAKAITNKEINGKVMEFAKKDPDYAEFIKNKRKNNDPNRLDNAIEFLERKYKLPGDGAYKGFKDLGITDTTHHLDDFCHHPTLIGLVCCVIVQFTKSATYRSSSGAVVKTPIEVNQYGKFVSENKWGKILSGVINWFFNVAQTMANRKGHLLSDMAGSSTSAGKGSEGAGIPGSMLSLAKELASLSCFKDTKFAENLRKAYQNGIGSGDKQLDFGAFNSLFEGASSKVDMRTEMAVAHELKRQAMPVILNELLVRGVYFIRRFIQEMKEKNSLREIEWKNTFPFKNRTIVRMMTIASGTFSAVDLADAGIRAVVKSGGFNPVTLENFILRVNFVGVGRFAVAVGTDVAMGIKKSKKENERIILQGEQLQLLNAKVFYKEADMWIEAENTEKAIQEACIIMEESAIEFDNAWNEIKGGSEKRRESIEKIKENDRKFADELFDLLEWGI